MQTRLQAEEAMAFADAVSVATGSLTEEAARHVTQGWLRAAHPDRQAHAARATPEMLHAAGIAVRRITREDLADA